MVSLKELIARISDGRTRHLLRSFNLAPKAQGQVPSVKELAEALGFEVDRTTLPRGMAGRLVPDAFARNGFRIEVNSKDDVRRQRWTVLHEMGHYFLHGVGNDPLPPVMRRDGSAASFYLEEELSQEREADEFAAVLLFGGGALEAAISLLGHDEVALARHFGVTQQALRVALRQFG